MHVTGISLSAAAMAAWLLSSGPACAGEQPSPATADAAPPPTSVYDAQLALRTGADQRGMRQYVLVILKSSATPVAAGPERDAMFQGHFANMERLAAQGKLVLAGPLDNVDGWRGLFVFAVSDIDEARQLVATDPVVARGEMVPEFHRYYGTAALVLVNDLHQRLKAPAP
jgi:uncharacterized protein YciI